MNTFASAPVAPNRQDLSDLALWTRVTAALASIVVSLTLLGAVSIGLTTPTFDIAAVAASTGRALDPIIALAPSGADD